MHTSTSAKRRAEGVHPHGRPRNRDLGRIHTLARDRELGEDAYRAVLASLTGKRSAANLDAAERRKVIAFMAGELLAKHRAAYAREVISDEEALEVLGVA